MVGAASWSGGASPQQGQGRWSELMERWMEPNEHKVRAAMEWFKTKHIHVLERPSQSPDLNPMGNLWQDLKTDVHKHSPSNLTELQLFCK